MNTQDIETDDRSMYDLPRSAAEGKWKYCVAGNIVRTHYDVNGILRYGTPAFSGGTKVYLCGRFWDPAQRTIDVIGLTRGNRYRVYRVPAECIENVRLQQVYKPKILEIMNNFEFWQDWWHNTIEDKRSAEEFIARWKESGTDIASD